MLVAAWLLWPQAGAFAGQSADFLQATQDYEAGRYLQAAKGFTALAEAGLENADLYFDAGNAWLKAGKVGRAILWYERARRLDPAEPDLGFNLRYARKLVRDEQPERKEPLYGMLLFWKNWLGLRTWAWGAAALSTLFWIVMGLRLAAGRPKSLKAPGAVLALALVFALAAGYGYLRREAVQRGVILAEAVEARSGTTEASSALFTLHEGVVVDVERERNGHVLVRYSTSKFGWIPKQDVGII
jgi:tetratricopeptide (TPR) repeat protein